VINKLKILTLFCAIVILLTACGEQEENNEPLTSTFITNAVIYDGSGGDAVQGSVRIDEGLIIALGDLTPLQGEKTLDAGGLALAPGFIDPHSHHDRKIMEQRAPKSLLAQGITTFVSGLDGGLSTFGEPFISVQNNFDIFEKTPAAVNMALFAPHDTYRGIVMGDDIKRLVTDEELEKMKVMLRRDMEAGALGLATGLEYEPSVYSDAHEVIELAKVAAEYGGKYSSHIRSEDVAVYPAIEEVITIAREANIAANFSHIKVAMYELYGQSTNVIEMLNNAREEGLDITADVYPYDGWQSVLGITIPSRDYYDREAAEYALKSIIEPASVIITSHKTNPEYEGKTLAQIAIDKNVDPVDLLMSLLQQGEKEKFRIGVIGRNISEDDIKNFMHWPYTAITTDGGIDGDHPRGQGTFSRVLSRYVRDLDVLSLPEAIRRMTSLPASNLGLATRGMIKEGLAADLVLFDPDTIQDHATFAEPLQYSTGISAVWVNGAVVFKDGEPTDARPGKILKREN
jgi:N-acyl-D-amino-acid deacylase